MKKMPSDILKIRESLIYNQNVNNDIKIASVGDIHLSNLVGIKDIDNILRTLDTEDPDYICMLGDLIDSPDELSKIDKLKELKLLITNSSCIAPTFVVLGSHDFIDESTKEFKDVIDQTDVWNDLNSLDDVYILNDKAYEDKKIFVGGYRQKREAYYNLLSKGIEDSESFYNDLSSKNDLVHELPEDKPKIFLTHSPEPIQSKMNQELLSDYDLIVSGHYHNGCVPSFLDDIWVPKNGGVITPKRKILPKEARGIVEFDGTYLIYNGGWTKIQDCAPKFMQPLDKICNRQMDITTISSDEELINEKAKVLVKNRKVNLK